MPEMHGANYCALRRLSSANDETLADVGETCERVPAASLPWLLADRLIEEILPPRPRAVTPTREGSDGG